MHEVMFNSGQVIRKQKRPPYEVCPDCNAHLDHCEICDCEKEKGSPDTTQNDPKDKISLTNNSISRESEHVKYNPLMELRISKNIPVSEIIEHVKNLYPKYDKDLHSKCEHTEEYGIELCRKARDSLLTVYDPEQLEKEKRRRNGGHKLTKKIACRLKDDEYEKLIECTREDGFDQMQAWLTYIVRNYLKMKTESSYDVSLAVKAQKDFCKSNGIPNFAPPFDGGCYHCGNSIYRPVKHAHGLVTGYTVGYAGNNHITCCPHCRHSFVD